MSILFDLEKLVCQFSTLTVTEALQQIKPGDKVTVKIDADMDTVYRGHVQDVSPDNGPVCVFVEELGQKYVFCSVTLHVWIQCRNISANVDWIGILHYRCQYKNCNIGLDKELYHLHGLEISKIPWKN